MTFAPASTVVFPVQYWIKALKDGIVRPNPLPPDMWSSWTPHNPPGQWIQYEWAKPVTLDSAHHVLERSPSRRANRSCTARRMAPRIFQRRRMASRIKCERLPDHDGFPCRRDVRPRDTRCLRAVFDASGDGKQFAAVAVQEWETPAPKVITPNAQQLSPANDAKLRCPATSSLPK
jgi:hypothetical protein